MCRSFESVLHKELRIRSGLSYSITCTGLNSFFINQTSGFGFKGFMASVSKGRALDAEKIIMNILQLKKEQIINLTNFINNLGYKNDYKIYQMKETESNRNITILNKLSNWFNNIVELLKQNKKVEV